MSPISVKDRAVVNGISSFLRRLSQSIAVFCLAVLAAASPALAGVLETVRARDRLVCGVGDGPKGYSALDIEGVWTGISADFCRALAAAVLGNKDAVKFRQVHQGDRLALLQSGEIDVLSRDFEMTSSHDTALGVRIPGVLVFDGQGFLVRKAQGVASALELSGTRICVKSDGTDAQALADYFGALRMPFELAKYDKWPDAVAAYTAKSCQVLSGDVSLLSLARQHFTDPDNHILLPEIAARHPLGPAVRQGDEGWFSVVRWTIYALIAAEELGITSSNVDAMRSSPSAEVRRFLGADKDFGRQLGLAPDWTHRMIKQVGNYGEIFERDLGLRSPVKLERRLNNLATKGGLHYAPSFR
jgi:general L-amino acid transport system substrate-binding protein